MQDSNALWYKDAIIYQLHVKSFNDSNDDGMGDFDGLTRKLDYLRDLGVTALWLLPFYPSPLRDDGSIRLSKRMTELGLCSRREADEYIEKGWVRVDGRAVSELGSRVKPGRRHQRLADVAEELFGFRIAQQRLRPRGRRKDLRDDQHREGEDRRSKAGPGHARPVGCRFRPSLSRGSPERRLNMAAQRWGQM